MFDGILARGADEALIALSVQDAVLRWFGRSIDLLFGGPAVKNWTLLCALSFPVCLGGVVGTFPSLSHDGWTLVALGFALWFRVLGGALSLCDAYSRKQAGSLFVRDPDDSMVAGMIDQALRDTDHEGQSRLSQVSPWLEPLTKAMGQLSLLLVGIVALVRLAYGEPILRLFV